MEKKIYHIIEDIYRKYGKKDSLTVKSVLTLSPFLKESISKPEVGNILNQGIEVDVNEVVSLFFPEKFQFETQEIGDISVEITDENNI